jgi:hypothetical protein
MVSHYDQLVLGNSSSLKYMSRDNLFLERNVMSMKRKQNRRKSGDFFNNLLLQEQFVPPSTGAPMNIMISLKLDKLEKTN